MNRISTTTYRSRLQAASAAILVALIALTGASWMTLTMPADEVVHLDRVVISGKRAADAGLPVAAATTAGTPTIQQLPRVTVVGRRDASADGAQVASACVAPAVC